MKKAIEITKENKLMQLNLKDRANNYIKMFEADIKNYSKSLDDKSIANKCRQAEAVYFRQPNYKSKGYKAFTIKKRPVINVCFTKNTVCFTFKYSCKKHYFRYSEYGSKWVVDKKDYFPYLQISY